MTKSNQSKAWDEVRERTATLLDQGPAALEAMSGAEIHDLLRELHAEQIALSEENAALREKLDAISPHEPSPSQTEAALRTLRESERQFRKIFEGAQIGIAIIDADSTIQAVNPFLCRWLGYTEEEIQDLGIAGITHPEDWEKEQKVIQSVLQGKCKAARLEKQYITKNGDIVWGDVVANLIYNRLGNLLFGIATVVDVTKRKRAEEAMKESEARFRRLAENAHDMIYRMSLPEGTYTYVSPAAKQVFGCDPEVFYQTPQLIRDLLHPDSQAYFEEAWRDLIAGQAPPTYEFKIIHTSGETRWVNQRNVLVRDDEGKVIAIEGIATDVTERKRAAEALRKSEARLQAILDHTPALIYIKDLQGRFILINRALEETLGIAPEDILGKTDDALFPAEFATVYAAHDKQALQFGRALQFDETAILADGEEHTFISVKFPITDADGEVYGLGGISTDITERAWMEEALRAAEREKETILNAMAERFIYYNTDLEVQWANQETTELMGHHLNEIIGRHCYEVWRQREEPCEDCPVQDALGTGEPRKSSITTPDGRVWNLRSYPIFRSEGGAEKIAGVVEIGEDITARIEAEAALRRSEARYHSLFRDSPISMWEEDYSGVKDYVDELRAAGIEDFETYFERHPEAAIHCASLINIIDVNQATLDLYEAESRAELLQELSGVFGKGTYTSFKNVLLTIAAGKIDLETQIVSQTLKDTIKHAIMKWHVLPGYEDSYAKVLISLTDITPLKRAEEAVRRRNRDLAMLNQAARTFSATLEPEQVFERVLNMVRDRLSVMASSIWLVAPHTSNSDAEKRALVCRYLSNPQEADIEGWRVPWGEGIVGWVAAHNESAWVSDTREDNRHFQAVDEFTGMTCRSILAVPLSGPDGVLGVLELVDNAPQGLNQADLRIAESLAATASIAIRNAQLHAQVQRDAKTKTLLLREVNHRVKNNLGAILGLLYVEQRHAPPEALPAYAPILERLTRRVTSLAQIHQMLTAADWGPLLLSDLAQRIIYQTAKAMTHGVQIALEVTPSPVCLPPNPAHHLALILNELTINTIEHALVGRDAVRIDVQITREDDTVTLIYHSDGPGYPPEVLERENYNAGLDIIQRMVAETLRGELILRNTSAGATAEIRFQLDDVGGRE